MTSESVECPDCGHEFAPDGEPDDGDDEPTVAAECEDCGVSIYHGEWHVLRKSPSDRVPDGTASKVQMGQPDGEHVCASCAGRPLSEFPDDGPLAGVDDGE